jgi:hypothetical protein
VCNGSMRGLKIGWGVQSPQLKGGSCNHIPKEVNEGFIGRHQLLEVGVGKRRWEPLVCEKDRGRR